MAMSAQEYRDSIAAVGLSQVGAADFFRVNPKTSRMWARLTEAPTPGPGVPRAVEIALRLMVAQGLSAQDVLPMIGREITDR